MGLPGHVQYTPCRLGDVSLMPYGRRRELYEGVIEEIRLFKKHFHVVQAMPEDGDPVKFYQPSSTIPAACPTAKASW